MRSLEIIKYPNPLLRESTIPVEDFSSNIKLLVQNMIHTMYGLRAVGLSAIQVGRKEQVFVLDGKAFDEAFSEEPLIFINPELLSSSSEEEFEEEGCLSFPGIFLRFKRPQCVKFRAQNLDGNFFEIEADGFLGRALQHEFDHLTGKLMIDRVSAFQRERIKSKFKGSGS